MFWWMDIISKMQNIMLVGNYNMQISNVHVTTTRNKTAARKTSFWILAQFQLSLHLK